MSTQVPAVPPKVSDDGLALDVSEAEGVEGPATPSPAPSATNLAASEVTSATAPGDGPTAASSEGPSVESLSAEITELREALKQQMASTPGIDQGPQPEAEEQFSLAQFMQSTLGR